MRRLGLVRVNETDAAGKVCNENVAMGSFPETSVGSLLLTPVNIARKCRKRKPNSNPKPQFMAKANLLIVAAALMIPVGVSAQSNSNLPVSRSAGLLRVTLPANQISLVALPMVDRVVSSGTVSAVAGATLTLSDAALPGLVAAPHSIQLVSGAGLGARVRISAATADSVTTAAAIAGAAAGDQYMIVPDDTIATIFGATNTAGLLGGSGAASSDEVYIQTGGVLTGYFYKGSGLGGTGWRRTANPSGASEPNAPIDPLTGVYVIRKPGGNPVSLDITGYTVSGRQKPTVVSGFNILSNPFTLPTTLGKSNLKDFVTGGTGSASADIVYLENGGVLTGYFFKNGGLGGTGWRRTDNPSGADQSGVVLTPGKAILFKEQAGTAGFTLQEPFTE